MKIKTLQYHKVFNLGNYSNEKIGVEIELAEGEDPVLAHFQAVDFVEKAHKFQNDRPSYIRANEIVNNADNYTGAQVKQATQIIIDFEAKYEPFIKLETRKLLGV